jgi:protein-S-isoprenylcysteine O-methyltransferase Ste14
LWRTLNFLAYLSACAAATYLYVKSVSPAQMGYEKGKDPCALSVLWIPLGIIMAMAEETDLVIRFGESYIKYRAKTGMFFPKGKPGTSFLSSIMGFFAGLFSSDDN